MTDSTYLAESSLDSWPARWNAEKRRRRAVRRELMQGIEARALTAATQLVDRESAPPLGRRGIAAHIACHTALVLGRVWKDPRSLQRRVTAFRVLGDQAKRAGLSDEAAVGMIETGVREALAVLRGDDTNGRRDDTRDAVLRNLGDEAEAFAGFAVTELRLGMTGRVGATDSTVSILDRLLDGRIADDELGAASAAVGLDASREYGLVLLVHTQGCMRELEAAAQDVERTVSGAVDLGLSDAVPISRRVVFPVVTHGRWIEARTHLHDIATRHGVLAIAPVAAPRLGRLADTYQSIERDLSRVVEGCGYTSGIIDPAFIGPACKADGMSPAPDDAGRVKALVLPA